MSKKTTKDEAAYAVPRYSTKIEPFKVVIDDIEYVADKKKYARLECEKLAIDIAASNGMELRHEKGMYDGFYDIVIEHFGMTKEIAEGIPLSIVCQIVAQLHQWVSVYSEKKKI